MVDVAVNGYGTIGKRVADAVDRQDDMEIVGVAKTKPNFEARQAVDKGYPLYAAVEDRADLFEDAGIEIEGMVSEMVETADVVVDATPSGVGEQNASMYEEADTKYILQGGEDDGIAEKSFVAEVNYDDCVDADSLRVVSCNTTGLSRLIEPLKESFGVGTVRATLVRRGGDPSQHGRGPINDILPNPVGLPSHHGPDVQTVLPDVDIFTTGLKVPATLMHMHSVNIEVGDVTEEEIIETLGDESRIRFVSEEKGVSSTGEIKEMMKDIGRPRGDAWENCVWKDSITVEDGELYLFQAIHQESDVVPENVDAIRAMTGFEDGEESIRKTDDAIGL
ncbi:type II glyceraldehyde-3-phosphate dehydrogenase [Halorutilales archaeon Cl-col2-1]